MITRWFIGVKQKSKGYFNRFSTIGRMRYDRASDTHIVDTTPSPSFTKQSALAKSFSTQEDAQEHLDDIRKDITEKTTKLTNTYNNILDIKDKWSGLTFDEQKKFLIDNDIVIKYKRSEHAHNRYNHAHLYPSQFATIVGAPSAAMITIVKNADFTNNIKGGKLEIEAHQNALDYLNKNLFVRQDELELKFQNTERRKIKWTERGEHETASNYCNICGGAVPSIPQLIISGGRGCGRTVICAICMGKLAQEANIQAGKVPDDILSQYEQDRFLRSMD